MRVVIVGPPGERDALRRTLAGSSLTVVGEAATLSEARANPTRADAFLLAPTRTTEPENEPLGEALTPRETEVLALLAEGLPNKAIATRLGISDQTVKFHVASICGKLGALNRTDAVRRAVRRGILTI